MEQLKQQYEKAGQSHVFHFWQQLDADKQKSLLSQLQSIDPQRINVIFKQATSANSTAASADGTSSTAMEPLPADCYDDVEALQDPSSVQKWRSLGLQAISQGQVGIVLLAGGQGTRLGSSKPKGCYDIQLPSHKSLFQLQAERIAKVRELALAEYRGSQGRLVWFVMTSGPTRADTEQFFKDNRYFGLPKEDVVFFEQGVLPALTTDGKIIMEDKDRVSVAPDGNGGIYAALRECGILKEIRARNIKYLHAYCVDNCLVRVGDPVFLGYCIAKKALCGAKVVKKAFAHEPVGVICKVGGKFSVVEYSEIKKDDAEATVKAPNGTQKLAYDAANIANHFYTADFLERICSREFEEKLAFHVASKKIKHINLESGEVVAPSKPNGIKLELFIFDIFPLLNAGAHEFAVLSVPRDSEFSPLKNAPGAGIDNPETSRRDLFSQSVRFLKAAGAQLKFPDPAKVEEEIKVKDAVSGQEAMVKIARVELSPMVSYDGENLSQYVKGKTLHIGESVYIDSVEKLKSLLK